MSNWGIDLGTTNTSIARWNDVGQFPEMLHLPKICRPSQPGQTFEVKYSVPSSVVIRPSTGWKSKVASLPFFYKRFLWGERALIGQEALEFDAGQCLTSFAPTFKPFLLRESHRTLARAGKRVYTARQVALLFLRELLEQVRLQTGERPRRVTFGTPVESFEVYRAQLKELAGVLGIRRFRTVDEPVAAAIGYGVRIDQPQAVLVIDFGGGTLDLALILIEEKHAESGRCDVIAKDGVAVGGNMVDAWLVEEFCTHMGYELRQDADDPNVAWWYRIMLEEACRLKESLFFKPRDTFFLTPPRDMRRFNAQIRASGRAAKGPMAYTRDELVDLLARNGVYRALEQSIDRVLRQADSRGVPEHAVGEVLMVGGSTLLPEIYSRVEARFGRDRVRAWQPFEAVGYGTCAFAAGHFVKSDFITHDYALVTYDRESLEPQHQVIVPAGTQYPTPHDFWKRQLTPTCPLGEPEQIFKLVIAELARRHSRQQEFVWDETGRLHALDDAGTAGPLVVPLNETNPTLGYLEPPHAPSDRQARLEISFGVNAERWLCATVLDLKTRRHLMSEEPVVRLK